MDPQRDLELLLTSHIPIIIIETHEERRVMKMLSRMLVKQARPLFQWTITEGLARIDIQLGTQRHNSEPDQVLRHIKSAEINAVYVLADFHPYLDTPMHVRLLKDIALDAPITDSHIILMSHGVEVPDELQKFSARFVLALPDKKELEKLVRDTADEWLLKHPGKQVQTDRKTLDALINNLSGLSLRDARRLARNAIFDDGAITQSDLPKVMKAKYDLLNTDGVLAFEYDTADFSDVGGLSRLKAWLEQRRAVFHGELPRPGMDIPKGILLLGVQGCGKSLAAKAVAGIWNVPLLRLDFGALYNKYHGESERNLREALKTAEIMAPCVLWMDEIEKGIAVGDNDGGTSRRMLATLLTWMAEKKSPVFIVATANDIERLPPELVRKGRFDEIFFVDLPTTEARQTIFTVHMKRRGITPEEFDLPLLVSQSEGFSGAEIEQAIVAALYAAHAQAQTLRNQHLLDELQQTRPLSVVMAEPIARLRSWAADRTVASD
ncbi:AAA family ATPase [Sulfuriflexus mobilis]|uniref:AAA family ATPase n=1 Tax=Sulfuriflexus mobilis TaxID=1811807 RepID=UPI000F818D91|nr:AAA family ATPase [Sulfuriflexus mobilis]